MRVLCFLILPWLPSSALFLPGPFPIVRDQIVVGVLLGVAVAIVSAGLARASGRRGWVAVGYGVATAALSVVAFVIVLGITLEVVCGEDSGDC